MPLTNPILKASVVKMGEKKNYSLFFLFFFSLKVFFLLSTPRAFSGFQPGSHSYSALLKEPQEMHKGTRWSRERWAGFLHSTAFLPCYIQGRGWGQTHLGVCFWGWACAVGLWCKAVLGLTVHCQILWAAASPAPLGLLPSSVPWEAWGLTPTFNEHCPIQALDNLK